MTGALILFVLLSSPLCGALGHLLGLQNGYISNFLVYFLVNSWNLVYYDLLFIFDAGHHDGVLNFFLDHSAVHKPGGSREIKDFEYPSIQKVKNHGIYRST